MDLTRYLISQVSLMPEDRLDALRAFFPAAKLEDWTLRTAGQRVQIIKEHPEKGGVLQFGTELVSAADGSLAALLGASPGASTAVSTMLVVLERCFPGRLPGWRPRIAELIPGYNQNLAEDPRTFARLHQRTSRTLNLAD